MKINLLLVVIFFEILNWNAASGEDFVDILLSRIIAKTGCRDNLVLNRVKFVVAIFVSVKRFD